MRRRSPFGAAWLALPPLLAIAATSCSSAETGGGETTEDELTTTRAGVDRWSLPPAVSAAGARLRLRYEDAPAWDSGRHCLGSLREGAQDLGRQMMRRYDAIASVGGYACRPNTADSSRTSVHGTGRALDIMIPTHGANGRADTAAGDPIANWLVVNAASIGVQLIIWNHTMWRANGTNEAPYTGPNPHVDHLHVEINERAASRGTPFFLQGASREITNGTVSGVDPYEPKSPRNDAGNAYDEVDASDVYDPYAAVDGGTAPLDPYDPYSADPVPSDAPEYPRGGYVPDDDPYGVKNSAPPVYSDNPGSGDPVLPAASPGTPIVDGGVAPAPTPTPTPYPSPSRADDSVGAPDSLGTGTRATPRTAANVPKIETCALIGGVGRASSGGASAMMAWLVVALSVMRSRRAAGRARE